MSVKVEEIYLICSVRIVKLGFLHRRPTVEIVLAV